MPGEFIARQGLISRGNVVVTGSLTTSGSLTTTGTITATTLVVQTITSSISSITGSTNFGSIIGNTHTFTGSVLTSGSVGIGTTPAQTLTLVGGQTSPGSFSGNYTFGIYSGSASTVLRETFAIGSDSSYIYMQSFSSRPLYINSAGNNIILGNIASATNVGIGTTDITEKFTVNVGVGARAGMALTGEYPYLRFNVTSSSANARNWAFNATNAEPGDFALLQSTAKDGNPVTAGTSILGFGRSGAATFASSVGVGGIGAQYATLQSSNSTFGSTVGLLSLAIVDGTYNPRSTISYKTQVGSAYSVVFGSGYSSGWGATNWVFESGNIGIGTATPNSILEVQRDTNGDTPITFINGSGGSGNTNASITLDFILRNGSGGSSGGVKLKVGKETDHIGANVNDYFAISTTANDAVGERMRISAAGVTTLKGPTQSTGTQTTYALAVGESGYPNLTLGYKQATAGYIQTWSSTALYLNQQGNAVYAGAVRLDTLSDQRIKDNIQPISGSLNKVLQLNGKKFHLKDEPEDKIRYGFIAQDLEGILDEFVIQTDMTFTKGDLVVENVKSIENWASSWAALLVEAIKELKAENNTLKSRIEALENK